MAMNKVWSVTINGKSDVVVMNDREAMIVKMKFMPGIKISDLTTRHNLTPEHLYKITQNNSDDNDRLTLEMLWMKNSLEMGVYGGIPGEAKPNWKYKDLLEMK